MSISTLFVNNPYDLYCDSITVENGFYSNTTANSTDTLTGSLIVSGGAGIAKDVYVGGGVAINDELVVGGLSSFSNTSQSNSSTSGSLVVNGGVGIVKNLNVGGQINTDGVNMVTASLSGSLIVSGIINAISSLESISTSSGSLIVSGGVGIAKNLNVEGNINCNSTSLFLSTKDSTSVSTGSLIVIGGAGISKNLYVGGTTNSAGVLTVSNTTPATNTQTGSLIVNGGVGIAKKVYLGDYMTTTVTGNAPYVVGSVIDGPNLTAGGSIASFIGKGIGSGLNNSSYKNFYYDGSGSPNNYISYGFNGNDNLFKMYANGQYLISKTTQATDISTGSLVVAGGCGIAKNLCVGGNVIHNLSNFPANNTSAGIAGTISADASGNLYVCTATNTWKKYVFDDIGPITGKTTFP